MLVHCPPLTLPSTVRINTTESHAGARVRAWCTEDLLFTKRDVTSVVTICLEMEKKWSIPEEDLECYRASKVFILREKVIDRER